MRKLRWSLGLATLQSSLALTLVVWSRHIPPEGGAFRSGARASIPTLLFYSHGLSLPAWLAAKTLTSLMSLTLHQASQVVLFGYELSEVLFVVGVFVLWFIVGRVFDYGCSAASRWLDATTNGKIVINLALLILAFYLLVEAVAAAVFELQYAPNSLLNDRGVVIALGLLWALILAVVSGRKIVAKFRTFEA